MDETDVIKQLEADEFYRKFLEKNPMPHDFPTHLTIGEQVEKLGQGIDLISRELQKCVLEKHIDLLKQASHPTKLDSILSMMSSHVHNIVANAERLKSQINVPCERLNKHTQVLGKLHLASHILRQVSRIQQLSKQLGNINDSNQKAAILLELEQMASDEDLENIEAVTSELRNCRSQQQKLVQIAMGSLNQGIVNENIIQSTLALQFFINLGTIEGVLDKFLNISLSECEQSIKNAFESLHTTISKGGPGRINLTSSQGFQNKVWSALEKAFSEDIQQQCRQIKFLQTTLSNMDIQDLDIELAKKFWSQLGIIIKEQLKNVKFSIQQMLEDDYPRLLRCYSDMSMKLNYEFFVFDQTVLEEYEAAYLSKSMKLLLEPIQALFTSDFCVPSHDEIDKLVRAISNNLYIGVVEENLSKKICQNISRCIKMFIVKTEQQLDTSADSAQVIGGCMNAGQQKNLQLANRLYYFQTQMKRILIPEASYFKMECICETMNSFDILSGAIIQPLVVSINSTIETIIVTVHLEADWSKTTRANNKHGSCSPYMRELSQFITRVFNTYLVHFENKDILLSKCSQISVRCIELFVRHTTLLRPNSGLSQGDRQRLQADYAHLENSLKILCPNLSELGKPYKLLKSVSSLITMGPAEIIDSHAEGSVVPPSTILLLLFSYAGNELASPYQNTGWSLQKFSIWLDEHQLETDRLDLIAGALLRYEAVIRHGDCANYDPVYPLMSEFLRKFISC